MWKAVEKRENVAATQRTAAKPTVPAFVSPTLRLLRAGFVENRDEWGNLSCGGAQAAPRAVVKEVRIIGMPSAKLCQELKDYGVIAQNEPR